jgi:hypothetical protein
MFATSTSEQDFCRRAIAKMRSPYEMKIICIDVTNKCDLACSNCTRLLENQDNFWDMTPENFRLALRSLAGFPGIIAMIGGNPTMHRHFEELCTIFTEEIPNKAQRGLWTNNCFKYSALAKEVFGTFNLNPHGDARGIRSLADLKDLGWYHEGHSTHAPLLTAIKDLYDAKEMWRRIAQCDVNQNWSASIVQVNGKLRAYFCEIGGSFDLARNEDHGIDVLPGWWHRNIAEFETQVRHFCPGCGVAARIVGDLDSDEIDTYTKSNADLAEKAQAKRNRKIVEISSIADRRKLSSAVTEYSERLRLESLQSPLQVGLLRAFSRSGARPAPRVWLKPLAEFFLTVGRSFRVRPLSHLGEWLWHI